MKSYLLCVFVLLAEVVLLVGCGGGSGGSVCNGNIQFQTIPVDRFTENRGCVSHDDFLNTSTNYWDCSSGSVKVDRASAQGRTLYDLSSNISDPDIGLNKYELKFHSDDNVSGTMSVDISTRECGGESGEVKYRFDGCNAVVFIDSNNDGYVIDNLNSGFMNVIYGFDSVSGYVDGVRVTMHNVVYNHDCRLRNRNSRSVSRGKSEPIHTGDENKDMYSESNREFESILSEVINNLLLKN